MADRDISALASIGAVLAESDELHVVDISEALPADEDKKILTSDLRKAMGHLLELIDYQETLTAPASSAGTLTLDLELGNVFHATLLENVSTLTISNWPTSGVAATGSFDLNDMAAADTLDTVTVNGVEILGGAETFITDLATTATAVAAAITANSSTPNYTATAAAGIVTIVGTPARGVLDNNLVVGTTETGFTVTSKTDMSGGSTSVAGSLTLYLRQDTTGSRTFAWPAGITWAGGTAPTITAAANALDVFTLITPDGGATIQGMTGGQDFS